MKPVNRFLWLPAIPIVAALAATTLFLLQHGFGGGHGDFDFALGVLSLPGILVIEHLPFTDSLPDYLLIVLIPAVLNILLWFGLALILRGVSTTSRHGVQNTGTQ